MASTTRTTIDRPTADALRVSSFERTRLRANPRRTSADAPSRPVGSSAIGNPRRDLQMFSADDAPTRQRAWVTPRFEKLAPLLPPIESDPARTRRVARARVQTAEPVAPLATVRREPAIAPRPTGRLRLTMRGYGVLLGLAVAAIAGTSAVSVAGAEPSASVATTEVVARPGESVADLAARTAQGRDVGALSNAIEAANGLADGAVLQAGDVVVVPGQ